MSHFQQARQTVIPPLPKAYTRARRHVRRLSEAVLLLTVFLTFGLPIVAVAQDESGTSTPSSLIGNTRSDQPCFDGRLRIRDLEDADSQIPKSLENVTSAGKAWESDAVLFSLRLGCPLLDVGYQLEGTFFSATAQAFYSTGTGETVASNDSPGTITGLDTSQGITVAFVYSSLIRAGFAPDSLLDVASGVTIQTNTKSHPFGPPSAPTGAVYFHVAVVERGEVRDVWISSSDGTIYRYAQ